ncbi:MAG: hypothetical protein ABSF67_14660 [Roseiarcus sp.]
MDRDAELLDDMRGGGAAAEFEGVARPFQATAHFVGGVVIATDHRDRNSRLVEIGEAADKAKTALEVAPVAVKNVAGDHNKIDSLVDGELDHLSESPLRGAGKIFRLAAGAFAQAGERAIEMEIGGVNEPHDKSPR